MRGVADGASALTGSADYDVFGTVRSQTGTTSAFGFTGELFSPESGLLHLHARDMHPQSGRFLSTDSVQPNAPGTQGFNVYSYVANNPTSWADPSGHSVLPQFMLSLEESVGTGLTGLAAGLAKVFLYIHQHRQYRF